MTAAAVVSARRPGWIPPVVAAILFAVTVSLLWHPVGAAVARGASVDEVAKDFVLSDQLSYMVMARNAADGQSVHREPFTETGSSLYAGGHMWLVGKASAALGLSPLGAWNVVGFGLSVLLLVAFGAWGFRAAGNPWGWLAASVPVLVGLLGPGWSVSFAGHSHAVLWPAFAILYAGGVETPALLLAFVALVLTARAGQERRGRMAAAAAAGVATGLCLEVHIYVAMFAVTTGAVMLALSGLDRLPGRARWRAMLWAAAATGLAVVAVPAEQPVGRLAAVVAVTLVGAAVVTRETGGWRAPAAFAVGAAVGAGPQLARIGAAALRGDDFLRLRQQASADLSLPPLAVLLFCAPILAVAICSLVSPTDDAGGYQAGSRGITRAVLVAGSLLTFNNVWGLGQEPYRFLPYMTLFLGVATVPWLVRAGGTRPDRAARVVCTGLLLLTLPSTVRFATDVSGRTATLTRAERDSYVAIAAKAHPESLVLVDSCIPSAVFKVATGAPVAGYNPGIAYPAEVDAIRSILEDQRRGEVPGAQELRRARVGLIVKDTACHRSGSASAYTAAFGPPFDRVGKPGAPDESLLLFRPV